MNKSFSPGFQQDIADLLDICMENGTDTITITMGYEKADLDIDMTFRVVPHKGADNDK